MTIAKPVVSRDVFPYLRVYDDGTIERYAGTEVTPPGLDSQTNVLSKDVVIDPETGVSARLYRPNTLENKKLPLLVYYHGGAFCIASPAEPKYHCCLNNLVAEANIIAVSVDYRLAPEHPLPVAYEDSWAALRWVADGTDGWLQEYADFGRLFLGGDSAGANIAHNLSFRVKKRDLGRSVKIKGIVSIHPYFWGKDPIGMEGKDDVRKAMVDNWWSFVCPSDKGSDDPYINPFVEGAQRIEDLGCERVIVFVAEKDILSDRGKLYYDQLVMNCKWGGKAELVETKGEDHVFHIFNPTCDNACKLIKRCASFIHQQ